MKRFLLIVCLIVGLLIYMATHHEQTASFLQMILQWVETQGPWAPIYYICIFFLGTLLFLPVAVLMLCGGFLLGVKQAVWALSLGGLLAATGVFLAGRFFSRKWFAEQIEKSIHFQALDEMAHHAGWRLVFITRLAMIFPFNALNYAYGLSRIPLWEYVLATWIGMLPESFIYAYIGASAGSWAGLRTMKHSPWQIGFTAVSVIASALATIYIIMLSRKMHKKFRRS